MGQQILRKFILSGNKIEGWNLATASYDNVSFSVAGQDTTPNSIFIKPDGTKMYITGFSNIRIYQYTLSSPWALNTASYDNVSFSVVGQDTSISGVHFKSDGTKMYITGYSNDRIYQYTLSTPWELNTASYDNISLSVVGQDTLPRNVYFKSDGIKLYVTGSDSDSIYQYTLSTPWELNTASYDNISLSVAGQNTTPRGLFFKPSGTKIYILGLGIGSSRIYQYTLSSPWELNTASYDNISFSVVGQDSFSGNLFFKLDGTKMYMVGSSSDSVHQYSLTN